MTRATRCTRRAGFTLIELLVVMSVIVVLASIALVVVPDVMTQDRTTDGATMVRQQLMIAKARATRDGRPRGVRFMIGLDATNPAKSNALWVTELQYVEQPDPIPTPTGSFIEFVYTLNGSGQVTNRECYLTNLGGATSDVVAQIGNSIGIGLYPTLRIPALNLYVPIVLVGGTDVARGTMQGRLLTLGAGGDAAVAAVVGAGTFLRVDVFSLQPLALPLLGEPTVPLPRNICVDLASGTPRWTATDDAVLLFSPGGQVLNRGEGQINLWVRDYTKNGGNPSAYGGASYQQGGEQQVVNLKTKTGGLGVFPVSWSGDPFEFARKAATSP